jgi:Na+-transporting methylmalonyl-CoA/oxaloacetate decarboxylase gamma subunit
MKYKHLLIRTILLLLPLSGTLFAAIPKENRALIYNVTLAGILIVVISLLVVSLTVALMSKMVSMSARHGERRREKEYLQQSESAGDDTVVAIATALHLEFRARNEERKAILTITKALRPYSSWNNKAYGMRNTDILNR